VALHSRVAALDKDRAIACALRLAVKRHGSAEPVIYALKEHYSSRAQFQGAY
jgi:hypothetical protein